MSCAVWRQVKAASIPFFTFGDAIRLVLVVSWLVRGVLCA